MENKKTKKTIINKVLRKIKNCQKKISIMSTINIKLKYAYKWYGNEYGGFFICPAMIPPSPILYSAGVGEDISFDIAIMNDFPNAKIFAFDPTPKSIEWIKKQNLPDNYSFFPYGMSGKTEEKQFHLSNTPLDISSSTFLHQYTSNDNIITVQMKSLYDVTKEHQHDYIDILKMDIEGSEFSVIENLPSNVTFGQIAIEFHERFIKNGKLVLKKAIKQLKQKGYLCFAISNSGDEYSFINKNEYRRKLCSKE